MLLSVSRVMRCFAWCLLLLGSAYGTDETVVFQNGSAGDRELAKSHPVFDKYSENNNPEVKRTGLVRVNLKNLKALSGEVMLPLFDQENLVISVRQVERKSSPHSEIQWEGVVVGSPYSKVYMADFGRGEVHVDIKKGKDRYVLSPIGNGLLMVVHFDLEKFLHEAPPLISPDDDDSTAVRRIK